MRMRRGRTCYLAGKITGDPNYKEKFAEAQRLLERRGYIVINPAMLPSWGFTYAAYLRMSSSMLKECQTVALLPDWGDSNGATSERFLALVESKELIYL